MFIKLKNTFTKNPEALKELMEQVYYVDKRITNCSFNSDGVIVEFESGNEINDEYLRREILKMSLSILQSFERVDIKFIFENEGLGSFDQDPMDELINAKQVIETYPGVYALQGNFLEKVKELDSTFRNYALDSGAIEQYFQPTLPARSLVENGYIASFPHHPLFVTNVIRDANQIKDLSKAAKEESIDLMHEWLDSKMDTHQQVLSPTVCYHCFETLRRQSIPKNGILYTAIAPCHRHESKNIKGLSRLQTFTMREIIFFGSADFVETQRKEILSHCQSYLVDLGLKFRVVTASDPFFISGSEAKRIYQTALALKYEVQAFLPHTDNWISVASFNNHQQSLVIPYHIGFDSDADLHSGCVGYGYERLVYSFCSQFGIKRPL